MRRVWRLGQQQPVRVLFPIYRQTMESAALALMGQKMRAACLLYGDNAASAITEDEEGGGDFLAELAGKVLAGEALASDGITGLLKSALPEGTMPAWETPDDVNHELDTSSTVAISRLFRSERCRNRQHQVVAEQLALF